MRAWMNAADRRQLEGLARVGPVAAPTSTFRGPVVQQESVPELVLVPANAEVERVFAKRQRFAGAPPDEHVFGAERRDVPPEAQGHRPVGPFTDDADLAVDLARRCSRIRR